MFSIALPTMIERVPRDLLHVVWDFLGIRDVLATGCASWGLRRVCLRYQRCLVVRLGRFEDEKHFKEDRQWVSKASLITREKVDEYTVKANETEEVSIREGKGDKGQARPSVFP